MKKFKDFLYDKNDIIIALLILVIASLLIIWRMEAIMEYPKTLISDTESTSTELDSATDEGQTQDPAAGDTSGFLRSGCSRRRWDGQQPVRHRRYFSAVVKRSSFQRRRG